MLPPLDFLIYVRRSPPGHDQKVMAAVALNTLWDVEGFPVDLSQVMRLSTNNRVMTRAFLDWCAMVPKEYLSLKHFSLLDLMKLVAPERFEASACTP